MQKKSQKKHASQKTVCQMIKEARADEKKGDKFYLRLASKLPLGKRRVVSEIASQERKHKQRLEELGNELMCPR